MERGYVSVRCLRCEELERELERMRKLLIECKLKLRRKK